MIYALELLHFRNLMRVGAAIHHIKKEGSIGFGMVTMIMFLHIARRREA